VADTGVARLESCFRAAHVDLVMAGRDRQHTFESALHHPWSRAMFTDDFEVQEADRRAGLPAEEDQKVITLTLLAA